MTRVSDIQLALLLIAMVAISAGVAWLVADAEAQPTYVFNLEGGVSPAEFARLMDEAREITRRAAEGS